VAAARGVGLATVALGDVVGGPEATRLNGLVARERQVAALGRAVEDGPGTLGPDGQTLATQVDEPHATLAAGLKLVGDIADREGGLHAQETLPGHGVAEGGAGRHEVGVGEHRHADGRENPGHLDEGGVDAGLARPLQLEVVFGQLVGGDPVHGQNPELPELLGQ